jgi:hypothetical protein
MTYALAQAGLVRSGVVDRIRAIGGDVMVFAHRDILWVLTARWLDIT